MIILASKSPRRQQLLLESGFEFMVREYEVDETYPDNLKGHEVVSFLADKKAEAFPEDLSVHILITADTIVCMDGEILNKPKDEHDAIDMLARLSGRMHEVYTGVCLKTGNRKVVFYERTEVYFKNLMLDEIRTYVKHYKPFDKAGSYGIQDWIGYIGIERINGCYYNVMGLPVSRLYKELRAFNPKMKYMSIDMI